MNGRLRGKFSAWTRADLAAVQGAVAEVRAAQGRTDRALKAVLRARPELSASERAALAELSLGIAVHERRLAWALGEAAPPTDALIEAYLALVRGESTRARYRALPDEEPARTAVEFSVPDALAEVLIAELGAPEARAFLAACARPGPVTVRARDRDALGRELAEAGIASRPTARSPWGLVLEGRPNIRGLAAWRRGDLEVQDEGSQAIAAFCEVAPAERALDRCAGRGGKSLALWDAMEGRGRLVCTDVDEARLADLRVRAQRAGAAGLEVGRIDEVELADAGFDLVLVDAPCSETGTLRRSPDLRAELRMEEVDRRVALQRAILEDAARFVAPAGRLVYATCSVLRAENEGQVERFVSSTKGWALEAELRLWPHRDDTDGFYMARLRRASSPAA